MRKFCFCIPIIESGIFAAIYGLVIWTVQITKFYFETRFEVNGLLLAFFLALCIIGILFEALLIYAFMKVRNSLIKLWRIYQVGLIALLLLACYYDRRHALYILIDILSIGVEVYFTIIIRAFQKHLDDISSEPIEYHPVNEIDDDAYINDYY